MYRKTLGITLSLLLILAVGVMAEYDPTGEPLPLGAEVADTFVLDDGVWVEAAYAMSWNSGSAGSGGMSNAEEHSFSIVNHVSVAQWIEWSISGTRKDWRVLRPGTYASGAVEATVRSNNDVIIELSANDPEYLAEGGVTRVIPKWFNHTVGNDPNDLDPTAWVAAADTVDTPYTTTIRDSATLHEGYTWQIWEMIEVVPSNSSSDYEGSGTLTIRLTNMKHWVDPEADGGFRYEGGLGTKDVPQ